MKNIPLPSGIRMEWYSQLDSTNRCLIDREAEQGLLVVADQQLAGRGRMGREWQSAPGVNLYFSLALRPTQPVNLWGTLPLAVGVGLAEGLAGMGFTPQLKWPNDILLSGKKTGGILLETRGAAVVAGVGLNVNQLNFPCLPQATSLAIVQGKSLNRQKVLETVLGMLWDRYQEWCAHGPRQTLQQWRYYDIMMGKEVEIQVQGRLVSATVMDIAPDGALRLRESAGKELLVYSGDASIKYPQEPGPFPGRVCREKA